MCARVDNDGDGGASWERGGVGESLSPAAECPPLSGVPAHRCASEERGGGRNLTVRAAISQSFTRSCGRLTAGCPSHPHADTTPHTPRPDPQRPVFTFSGPAKLFEVALGLGADDTDGQGCTRRSVCPGPAVLGQKGRVLKG